MVEKTVRLTPAKGVDRGNLVRGFKSLLLRHYEINRLAVFFIEKKEANYKLLQSVDKPLDFF